MDIKIIKTEAEYEVTLARIEALMDAKPDSPQEEELDLLALLVEKYEEEHYPIEAPDPIEAIKFRMVQQGLEPKDMVQYLGSQSKVSEVLNYKRPLSLSMIRALNRGLGIPAEVLLQQGSRQVIIEESIENRYLAQSLVYYNCLHLTEEDKQKHLWNWQIQIAKKAKNQKLPPFDWERFDRSLFKELVQLSSYSAGPQMSCELLNKRGIYLIVQKISFESELDGACFFTSENRPIIGLTLRNNRLDVFWFTLFHLLAHLYLHRQEKPFSIFESIECIFEKKAPTEEVKTNNFLKEVLIPSKDWEPIIQSYWKTKNRNSLEKVIQTLDTSPEIINNLIFLEYKNVGIDESNKLFTPKKVSEKLEVIG